MTPSDEDPVCVVGIACRYPGQDGGLDGFWDTIVHARSAHSEFPPDRHHSAVYHHPNHELRKRFGKPPFPHPLICFFFFFFREICIIEKIGHN